MRAQLHVAIVGLFLSAQAGAVSVPNTFSAGQPANAADVNANFAALENAINAAGAAQFGSQYYIQPSSTGDLGSRNVIVLKENRGGTGTCSEDVYRVRVNFTNTNNVSVGTAGGGTVTPDEIWLFGYLCASGTTVQYAAEYLYAIPSSGGFPQAQGAEINEDTDGNGTFDSNNSYGYRQTYKANPLSSALLVNSVEIYSNGSGETLSAQSYSSLTSALSGSISVNGDTFNDVIVQNYLSFDRTRFRAAGIGVVQEVSDTGNYLSDPVFGGQSISRAIYYRMEGGPSGGSLSGTPFAPGETYSGIWFQ